MRVFLAAVALVLASSALYADPLKCDLSHYKALPGLTASVSGDALTLNWDGDKGQEVRLRFGINGGAPTIQELAVKRSGASWAILASNATPDFRVASGLRRVTDQQLDPLRKLNVEITQEIIDKYKWDAFWDAPLNLEDGGTHGEATPPKKGLLNQPGWPRKAAEIQRATATYQAQSCEVNTNGTRLEVTFPGVRLGVFAGRLQYTVFKGTNLIKQEVIAKTDEPSVAYKYEAGLRGLTIQPTSRVVWRDTANVWQDYRFGGTPNQAPVPLQASNRLVVAESGSGSIAAFPPPHSFFWSRETAYNLGYNFYSKDSPTSFSFGVRQADAEAPPSVQGRGDEDTRLNFALRSARPGTWQRMPVFFYVSAESGQAAARSALAFTRDDRFKAVPGYQVMATHFHSSLVGRLLKLGGLDARLQDFDVASAAGINIFAPIDGSSLGFGAPRADRLKTLAQYYEVARRYSDGNFLIMPNEEGGAGGLGGHNDLLVSHPVYWTQGPRTKDQPLVENDPTYGRVYHVSSPADMMEMAKRENLLIFMPHPRSKGSTGYPDAIKDKDYFLDEHYRGIGVRWGMGLDGSEQRLCEYRCLVLLDDMNNWMADLPTPLKYLQAITELYELGPGDDLYASNPVNYVKLAALPKADDYSPIIDAMKRGDFFWSSGKC